MPKHPAATADTGRRARRKAPATVIRLGKISRLPQRVREQLPGRSQCFAVLPAPGFRRIQKRPHQARVERVARLVGHKAATNRRADEAQIANGVQQLVTDEFVIEAQPFRVRNAASVHNDCVVQRRTPAEASGTHRVNIRHEAEGARVSNVVEERLGRQLDTAALLTNRRIGETDGDVEIQALKRASREQSSAFRAHTHFDWFKDADHRLRTPLLLQASIQQHLDERRR